MTAKTALTALAAAALLGLASCSSEPRSEKTPATDANQAQSQSTTQDQSAAPETQANAAPNSDAAAEAEVPKTAEGEGAQAAPTEAKVEVPENVVFAAYDTYGKLRNSTEWFGQRPVVVNFWGTWCPPCRREIPDLVRLYQEYSPKGVEILGVALRDQPESVEQFATNNNMRWTMLMGDLDIAYQFNATQGVPTTIFYDRTGKEITRVVGAQSYDEFKPMFEALL